MLILFATAIFSSAALLFLVQPMAAKMALPIFGGSPAVWNTAMLFFQAALLLGYLYAHLVTRYLKPAVQVVVHLLFAGMALLALPIVMPHGDTASWAQTPITSLLRFLGVTVGLPFLFTSTAGPLLQRWFSRTGHKAAADPYFLYAASNAGSLLGLLAYPFIVEPNLRLATQGRWWSFGFGAMALLALSCGAAMWFAVRRRGRAGADPPADQATPARQGAEVAAAARSAKPAPDASPDLGLDRSRPVDRRRRLTWILLAFVPSSLMIGVTQHISTDVAAVPLMWVIPLTLYLLSFIVAFSTSVRIRSRFYSRIAPIACVPVIMASLIQAREPVIPLAALHLLAFFSLAMLCHKRLAEDRPDPAHLTEFFLLMSVGGVLGGIFNGLIAPVVFNRIYEYPLVLGLALMLRNDQPLWKGLTAWGVVGRWFAGAFAVFFALLIGLAVVDATVAPTPTGPSVSHETEKLMKGIFIAGLPALVCFMFHRWVASFALGLAVLLCSVLGGITRGAERSLHVERTFFGVYDVILSSNRTAHLLDHGTTRHGAQMLDAPGAKPERSLKPLTYYFWTGPIGDVMDFVAGNPQSKNYAFVGLGAGTLAAYGQPGENFDFYEIDPAIERIARTPAYFTYLRDSDAAVKVIIGDARLKLAQAPDNHYGLIAVDAFSSDAIPIHLMTVEAVRMYASKLTPGGLIAFHVSNRFFDLTPQIGAIARRLGMHAAFRHDIPISDYEEREGKYTSEWVVVAREFADLAPLVEKANWEVWNYEALEGPVWTDDYSSLRSALR